MSNHTIDEEAFQHAYSAVTSAAAHRIQDDIMRHASGTEAEKKELCEKNFYRIFLGAYLTFKG